MKRLFGQFASSSAESGQPIDPLPASPVCAACYTLLRSATNAKKKDHAKRNRY
jgi:hypothetical protein